MSTSLWATFTLLVLDLTALISRLASYLQQMRRAVVAQY